MLTSRFITTIDATKDTFVIDLQILCMWHLSRHDVKAYEENKDELTKVAQRVMIALEDETLSCHEYQWFCVFRYLLHDKEKEAKEIIAGLLSHILVPDLREYFASFVDPGEWFDTIYEHVIFNQATGKPPPLRRFDRADVEKWEGSADLLVIQEVALAFFYICGVQGDDEELPDQIVLHPLYQYNLTRKASSVERAEMFCSIVQLIHDLTRVNDELLNDDAKSDAIQALRGLAEMLAGLPKIVKLNQEEIYSTAYVQEETTVEEQAEKIEEMNSILKGLLKSTRETGVELTPEQNKQIASIVEVVTSGAEVLEDRRDAFIGKDVLTAEEEQILADIGDELFPIDVS